MTRKLRTPASSIDDLSTHNVPFDDLFGFEDARMRQEEREREARHVELGLRPWRVFINHIDSYHGKKLADFLPEHFYDAPRADEDFLGEEEEDEDVGEERVSGFDKTEVAATKSAEMPRKFEVIGTVMDREYRIPEDVTMVIKCEAERESFLSELMKCGYVIYDITHDASQIAEAQWALEELEKMKEETPKAFKRSEGTRHFILISTIMTWALTKPLDPEDPDLPLTEADFRKRRPHPNFKEHIRCEKNVTSVKKNTKVADKFKSLVLCCGITYGDEEGPLHFLFKMAWQNESYLPVFGRGNNKIPLLHVRDIVSSVFRFLRDWPKLRYIVAVEQEAATQKAIVNTISKGLTTGRIKSIAKEEAFILRDVTQKSYDVMNLNLVIAPAYLVDQNLSWHFELPFKDNLDAIVKEYKNARNLHPVKVIVLGPPASGKTRVANYIAKHYRLHYICVKSLIGDTVQKLNRDIEAAKVKDTVEEQNDEEEALEDIDEDDEDANETETGVEQLQEQLDEIQTALAKGNGRLDDDLLNKIMLQRLLSKECQNQGYVLDGYPKTLEQAKSLFGVGDEDEEREEMEVPGGNVKIMPELVISLEAHDEFLIERVINLPEKEVQGTHYMEREFLRRLREYRERNTLDNTPLQFFDELEVHPLIIPVEDDVCPDMFPTFHRCLEKLGEPRNYGPTPEETEASREREDAVALAAKLAEEARKAREDSERKKERVEKMMEWTNLMEKLKEEEEERLGISSEPLRQYLVKYVFPTLTRGLIEVAKLRPEDPVDYLAEYLFKENPEGKMFEPDYTETMSLLLDAIERLRKDILPLGELDEDARTCLKRDEASEKPETDQSGITDADPTLIAGGTSVPGGGEARDRP
ncbi:adenylate kinase 7 [Orussus abietinus]|uniref:adenylate kinase 7 n=1 Tax=Orussus abietinus TaxID=222816 RepID=UPI000C716143|nr:adenylate kinase 7 [Orussus abietinus]